MALAVFGLGAAALAGAASSLQTTVNEIALAGADSLSGRAPGYPCNVARGLAEGQSIVLESCQVDGLKIRVVLSRSWGAITLSSRAHAGPAPTEPNLTSR